MALPDDVNENVGLGQCIYSYIYLVGGFNPIEKYHSKWESSPSRGENKKYLKSPPIQVYNCIYIYTISLVRTCI